jgi:uncharacterized protein (TIGR02300 family)
MGPRAGHAFRAAVPGKADIGFDSQRRFGYGDQNSGTDKTAQGAFRAPPGPFRPDAIPRRPLATRLEVAKSDIGTKRICPETGRKFYDLNKDPIVSPYTGQSYPRSYFESGSAVIEEDEEVEEKELDAEESGPEIVSLDEADGDDKDDDIPGIEDEEDVDIEDDDDDTFLAEDEEEDDDVSGIIGVGDDDEES